MSEHTQINLQLEPRFRRKERRLEDDPQHLTDLDSHMLIHGIIPQAVPPFFFFRVPIIGDHAVKHTSPGRAHINGVEPVAKVVTGRCAYYPLTSGQSPIVTRELRAIYY